MMPNRILTPEELRQASALLKQIRNSLEELGGGDPGLLFAFRIKIYKELTYDERSKPQERRKLKARKFTEQQGMCPVCNEPFPEKYTVLDRFAAVEGYTQKNTRLIHQGCDAKIQLSRKYS